MQEDANRETVTEQYIPPSEWAEHPLGPPPKPRTDDAEKLSELERKESISLPPIPSQPGTPTPRHSPEPTDLPQLDALPPGRESITEIRNRKQSATDSLPEAQSEGPPDDPVLAERFGNMIPTGNTLPRETPPESPSNEATEPLDQDTCTHLAAPLRKNIIPTGNTLPRDEDDHSATLPSGTYKSDDSLEVGVEDIEEEIIPKADVEDTVPKAGVAAANIEDTVGVEGTVIKAELKDTMPSTEFSSETGNMLPVSSKPEANPSEAGIAHAEVARPALSAVQLPEEVLHDSTPALGSVPAAEGSSGSHEVQSPSMTVPMERTARQEVSDGSPRHAHEGVLMSRESVGVVVPDKDKVSQCSSAKQSEADKSEDTDFAVHRVPPLRVSAEVVQQKAENHPQASNVARPRPLDAELFFPTGNQEPKQWVIPNTMHSEKKAPVQQWHSEPKQQTDYMFSPLPTGHDEVSKDRRVQLFEDFDMTGTGKLCLAEISRGVRDVLKLGEVFGECKYGVMNAFRAGTRESVDGLISKKQFRSVLCVLQSYLDLYKLFQSMTVGDTVSLQSWCSSVSRLRAFGIRVTQPDADYHRITGGKGSMQFSDFTDWVMERDTPAPSPVSVPLHAERPVSRHATPSPSPVRTRPASTHAVERGINSGGGGGDWSVRFYKGQDVLGAHGDIYQLHETLCTERDGVAEGNYLVLQPVIAEALFPVASSLAISKAGHVKKMIGKQYAQVLCTDPDARRLFLRSYELALQCFGVSVDTVTGMCVSEDSRFHAVVTRRSHNFKKLVTRMLHSLSTFGLPQFRLPLLSMLVDEMSLTKSFEGCKDACRSQWMPVLEDGRDKDLLFQRLNMVGKKGKAVGSGLNVAKRRVKKAPPPVAMQTTEVSSSRTVPQAHETQVFHGFDVMPRPMSGKFSTTYTPSVRNAPTPMPSSRPQTSRHMRSGTASQLPIRLEEDDDQYRLIVLGTPDKVKVVINLLSLQIRVLPPPMKEGHGHNTILIDDLDDFCESSTRSLTLASPIHPEAAVKESWGTRHTLFTFRKVPNNTTEL